MRAALNGEEMRVKSTGMRRKDFWIGRPSSLNQPMLPSARLKR